VCRRITGFYGKSAAQCAAKSPNFSATVVLPRRWANERTFSWFGRNRRLAKDLENLAETLGAFVALASIQLALRRLARA
jgi:transposase